MTPLRTSLVLPHLYLLGILHGMLVHLVFQLGVTSSRPVAFPPPLLRLGHHRPHHPLHPLVVSFPNVALTPRDITWIVVVRTHTEIVPISGRQKKTWE